MSVSHQQNYQCFQLLVKMMRLAVNGERLKTHTGIHTPNGLGPNFTVQQRW